MKTDTKKKIVTLTELAALVAKLKAAGKTIVTTNGCFDIQHAGHLETFEWAAAQGDVLVVGINSDHSVRENKGDKRPVIPEQERMRLVAGYEAVDHVFLFDEKTPTSWIEILEPNVHVKGPGSDRSPAFEAEKKIVEAHGGKELLAPHVYDRSTTSIIEKVLNVYS